MWLPCIPAAEAIRIGADVVLRPRASRSICLLVRAPEVLSGPLVVGLQQLRLLGGPGAGRGPGPERRIVPGLRIGARARWRASCASQALKKSSNGFLARVGRDHRLAVASRSSRGEGRISSSTLSAVRVRIGVRSVEMDVAGARPVEAVGKRVAAEQRIAGLRIARAADVAARSPDRVDAAAALLALIDGIGKAIGIDLVDEGELHDVAEARAQGRPGIRIDDPAGLGGTFGIASSPMNARTRCGWQSKNEPGCPGRVPGERKIRRRCSSVRTIVPRSTLSLPKRVPESSSSGWLAGRQGPACAAVDCNDAKAGTRARPASLAAANASP